MAAKACFQMTGDEELSSRVAAGKGYLIRQEARKKRYLYFLIFKLELGVFQSGHMGQTVNLLSMTSVVRIHPHPQTVFCGNSSVDRALAFQAGGRGFEPRFPLVFV